MTRNDQVRRLHDLALSLMRERGTPIPVAAIPIMEYQRGTLALRYWPQHGRLDVWHKGSKVMAVERWGGRLQLVRYVPGIWERMLAQAAKVAA
jgi:hypothetical protein